VTTPRTNTGAFPHPVNDFGGLPPTPEDRRTRSCAMEKRCHAILEYLYSRRQAMTMEEKRRAMKISVKASMPTSRTTRSGRWRQPPG
jgi:hypothetical protein